MGARGRGALVHNRAAHKNTRPGAQSRVKAIAEGEIAEGSAGYWNLVIGAREGHPSPWPRRRSPARRRAWGEWRDRIRMRWPFAWSHGRRPAAWFDFDMPALARKAGLSTEAVAAMSDVELVYHVDAGAAERAQIEDQWRRDTEHARDATGGDRAAWRAHATDPEGWDAPGLWREWTSGLAASNVIGSGSTTLFATKGMPVIPTMDIYIHALLFAVDEVSAATYFASIFRMSPSSTIAEVISTSSIYTAGATQTGVVRLFELPSPVLLVAGTRYAFTHTRSDATDTTSSGLYLCGLRVAPLAMPAIRRDPACARRPAARCCGSP